MSSDVHSRTGATCLVEESGRLCFVDQIAYAMIRSPDNGSMADATVWNLSGKSARFSPFRKQVRTRPSNLPLGDGSRVAVVGGGPAGSMFSYFLLQAVSMTGTEIDVDIYEPRDFSFIGPAGCNHCGGIVSESLVQLLSTEGIVLPQGVVQRGIDSYDLHSDVGSVRIKTPLNEKRIAAVYRGNGPRDSEPTSIASFDRHLLDLARSAGSRIVQQLVTGISWEGGYPHVVSADGKQSRYDLVVLATGVNSAALQVIEELGLGFKAPTMVKTCIAEFYLGEEVIHENLGSAMHVFLLDLPHLQFAAAIPKGDFVTVAMLGDKIDGHFVSRFFDTPEVRARFPDRIVPINACHCFPRMNVRGAQRPFSDRLVMIGDCGVTRLYKDGIGAAYRTAKAAAMAAALHGVSEQVFHDRYWPACRAINFDNALGRLIFGMSHVMQRFRFARRGVFRMAAREQASDNKTPHMSSILWDLFTGSAPYREVFLHALHPMFLLGVFWNLLASSLSTDGIEKTGGVS